jgi:hypothetical protein
MSTVDTKEGHVLDRTLSSNNSVPCKDVYSPPEKPKPAIPGGSPDAGNIPDPTLPRPSRFRP